MKQKQQKHGFSKHPLYRVRCLMIERTSNPKNCHYNLYGGRGITVCDEWKNNPKSFFEWAIANGYKRGLSIDRIDNNGNYCPENCRWVTQKEQTRNTRRNNVLSYNGKTMCVSDWAKQLGFSHPVAINNRLKRGWSIEKALSVPCGEENKNHWFLLNGEKICLRELCRKTGFNCSNYYARIKMGKNKIKDIFKGIDFNKFKIEEYRI